MQTSLMPVWGCMEENTLPCEEQKEYIDDISRTLATVLPTKVW